jgi:hypothetical protein
MIMTRSIMETKISVLHPPNGLPKPSVLKGVYFRTHPFFEYVPAARPHNVILSLSQQKYDTYRDIILSIGISIWRNKECNLFGTKLRFAKFKNFANFFFNHTTGFKNM